MDDGTEPVPAGQIERVLAAAEHLATGLRGSGAISAAPSLVRAYTALGNLAAAEQMITNLLPAADPADGDAEPAEDADNPAEAGDEMRLIAMPQEGGISLADALVAAGKSEQAATFIGKLAGRLAPRA